MALHFVGFRGDEYHRAVRVFGPLDFIHIGWDWWARQEVVPGDVAVFARGSLEDVPSAYSFPNLRETWVSRHVDKATCRNIDASIIFCFPTNRT